MTITDAKAGFSSHCRDNRHATCRGLKVEGCSCPCHPAVAAKRKPGPPSKPKADSPGAAPSTARPVVRPDGLALGGKAQRPVPFVSRNDCPTCVARRDAYGRMPIGFCGPDCAARKARDERLGVGA